MKIRMSQLRRIIAEEVQQAELDEGLFSKLFGGSSVKHVEEIEEDELKNLPKTVKAIRKDLISALQKELGGKRSKEEIETTADDILSDLLSSESGEVTPGPAATGKGGRGIMGGHYVGHYVGLDETFDVLRSKINKGIYSSIGLAPETLEAIVRRSLGGDIHRLDAISGNFERVHVNKGEISKDELRSALRAAKDKSYDASTERMAAEKSAAGVKSNADAIISAVVKSAFDKAMSSGLSRDEVLSRFIKAAKEMSKKYKV